MRALIKIAIITAVAGFFTLAVGGNFWMWLVGIVLVRLFFEVIVTISLAIIIYVLIYALIIGGLFWILIS